MPLPEKIRNIAIIAHIDHGKTTLVDALLKYARVFRENEAVDVCVMDSQDQEKERGITISAKQTSIPFEDYKINIVDTPGHADFGGEVDRALSMINSVVLVVDAQEGPMPQTRYVLKQALKKGFTPIVFINKIDRPHVAADEKIIARAHDQVFDLFAEMGATDEQLDFPVCYGSGFKGFSCLSLKDPRVDMRPLLQMIVDKVPAPKGDIKEPFRLQATGVYYDNHVGRQALGRVEQGTIKMNEQLVACNQNGLNKPFKITRIENAQGIKKAIIDEASCGDIVTISGYPEVNIGDTFCSPSKVEPMDPISIGEPTLSMQISANSSPLVGKDKASKHVTMSKIKDRLEQERRANISLKIESVPGQDEVMRICGRGVLHVSVLLESMRREGYEFSIGKPQVILIEKEGKKWEPIERVFIEVPQDAASSVTGTLLSRKGIMQVQETNEHGVCTMEFLIPTRGLMGYRGEFMNQTKGKGLLNSIFEEYEPWKGDIPARTCGSLISMNQGVATPYSIGGLQKSGEFFIQGGDEVYEGQVIGENSKENDLIVNVIRPKHLTNFRVSGKEETIVISAPRVFTLETAIEYIADDELVEVTPSHVRLRKRYLSENERKKKGG